MALDELTVPADKDELFWAQDEQLARLFAQCASFQTVVGEANATDTLNHIITFGDVDGDFDDARILVRFDGNMERVCMGVGEWKTTGSLTVFLERKLTIPAKTNEAYRNSKTAFRQFYSKLLAEAEDVSDASAAILGFNPVKIARYSIVTGPWMIPASEATQYDESLAGTAEVRKNKLIWWMELEVQLY